jgi:hypothetical protein
MEIKPLKKQNSLQILFRRLSSSILLAAVFCSAFSRNIPGSIPGDLDRFRDYRGMSVVCCKIIDKSMRRLNFQEKKLPVK